MSLLLLVWHTVVDIVCFVATAASMLRDPSQLVLLLYETGIALVNKFQVKAAKGTSRQPKEDDWPTCKPLLRIVYLIRLAGSYTENLCVQDWK